MPLEAGASSATATAISPSGAKGKDKTTISPSKLASSYPVAGPSHSNNGDTHRGPSSPTTGISPSKSTVASPPKHKITIVFYDLDGTLIKTRRGADFPANRQDWQWWDASVPETLKREREEGKHLVVLSNQGDGREKIRSEWRAKLPLIVAKVGLPESDSGRITTN